MASLQRSRPLQGLVLVLLLSLGYLIVPFFWRSSPDAYSPEEINSILQNKDDVVTINKRELAAQALVAPYLEPASYKSKNWEFRGNTLVKTKDYVRLTSDIQHQAGNAFLREPIAADSFEMEVTFHIHGRTTNGFVGDGLAFWLLDQPLEIGDVFGVTNHFNGLGIMIDTYKNGKRGHFPYVNIMHGDGQTWYDKNTDGYETRLAGCKAADLLNPKQGRSKARIVYIKGDGYLSVDFDAGGSGTEWRNCVTLSGVHLPATKYLGFLGETGGLLQCNDVIENKIYGLYGEDGKLFVGSFAELEQLIQRQTAAAEEASERQTGKNRLFKKKTPTEKRKSLSRLRNAEKRIKERERQLRLEKYGDAETTFLLNLMRKVGRVLKWALYASVAILAAWVIRIAVRVHRQHRHHPRTTGLLD